MAIGVVGIQTSQRNEPAGAPFPAGSADNGLSVDSVSGQIVLGQDPGAPGSPALLANNREIPMNGRTVFLTDGANQFATLQSYQLTLNDIGAGLAFLRAINRPRLELYDNVGTGTEIRQADTNRGLIQGMDGNGIYVYACDLPAQDIGKIDPLNAQFEFGIDNVGVLNGATVDVRGSLCSDLYVNTTGGALGLDPDLDKGKVFTNQVGASTFTLPSAISSVVGLHYLFVVETATNLVVDAPAGVVINVANIATVAGGTVTSATIGSSLHIIYIGNSTWVALSSLGAWVVA